jgi:hypothetical protein
MNVALYRRVLGAGFDALPARVRELHDLDRVAKQQHTTRSEVARLKHGCAARLTGGPGTEEPGS